MVSKFQEKRTLIIALKHLRIFLSYLKFLEKNDHENNHLWRNNKTKSYMFGSNNIWRVLKYWMIYYYIKKREQSNYLGECCFFEVTVDQ